MNRPTTDDLNGLGRARLEWAYANRTRRQCSRDDFADGYVAALLDSGSVHLFGPETVDALRGVDPASVRTTS